ncbi:MAG: PglB [Clostridiaceae bacterium]|nr:PglB [Clostridiaceae bacterium]
MNKNLLILGAGGLGRVVKEVAEAMKVFDKIDFLDDDQSCELAIGKCINHEQFLGEYSYVFPAFEANELRFKWGEKLRESGFTIPVLIHPSSYISPSASVYPGTIVMAHATINANTVIERYCIIGLGTIVDHDTFIAYACHLDCGSIVKSHCVVKAYEKIDSGKIITRNDLPTAEDFLESVF